MDDRRDEIKPGHLFAIVEAGPWDESARTAADDPETFVGGPCWSVIGIFNFGPDDDLKQRFERELPPVGWPDDASRAAISASRGAEGPRWAPSRRTLEAAFHDRASASGLTLTAVLATMRVFSDDKLYTRTLFFVT